METDESMKDPIHLCDVVLYDGKTKREYRVNDVVLSGNDKGLIWGSDVHRDRLIELAFKSPARIKKQKENLRLSIKSIDFKVHCGYSFYKWGLTK
tara:strand:+ start:120 stop:404 length:285 start_codon:yes stop_codon:yes gene_type:complete